MTCSLWPWFRPVGRGSRPPQILALLATIAAASALPGARAVASEEEWRAWTARGLELQALLDPSSAQRDWMYAVTLGTIGFPWPELNASQLAALAEKAALFANFTEADNLKYGQIVDVIYTNESRTSIVEYDTAGDSCTWTGHYLASLVFAYAGSGDPATLQKIVDTLGVYSMLVTCTSKPGYIARVAMPTTDAAFAMYYLPYVEGHYVCEPPFQDRTWLGYSSRDVYTGFALGVGTVMAILDGNSTSPLALRAGRRTWGAASAAQRAQEQAAADTAKQLVSMVATTMLADGWWIISPQFNLTNPTPTFATVWQRLALVANASAFAGKFDFNASFYLAAAVDMGLQNAFFADYFANNLLVDLLFVLSAFEDDPGRRQVLLSKWNDIMGTTGAPQLQPNFAALFACSTGNAQSQVARGILQGGLADYPPPPKWDHFVDQALNPIYFPHQDSTYAEHALLVSDRPPTHFLTERSPNLLSGGLPVPEELAGLDVMLAYYAGSYCGLLS